MWQRFKNGFRSFMVGRNGSDQLSFALLIAGIICSLISSLTGLMILYYAGMAIYIWSLFRMFSRNVSKRAEENRLEKRAHYQNERVSKHFEERHLIVYAKRQHPKRHHCRYGK